MTPCTLWFRYIQEDRLRLDPWAFNHLEDGHATTTHPAPKVAAAQGGWARARWERTWAWLTADVPPRVVHYGPGEA